MKWFVASVAGLLVAGFSFVVIAAEGDAKPERKRGEGIPAEALKRFDKDGDGKLSEAEKAEAQKALEARRGAQGNPEGRKRPDLSNLPENVLKRFDKDGDGKLSDAEKAEAQKAIEARKGGQPGAGRAGGAKMEELIKKFDKDGDGKLNEEERAAAKAAGGGPARTRPEKKPE
jgi:Ca2+-binding EF-hand superfamily protein